MEEEEGTCQYSKQIVSTDVQCTYNTVPHSPEIFFTSGSVKSSHIVLIETQQTQATVQVTSNLPYTSLKVSSLAKPPQYTFFRVLESFLTRKM